MISILNETSNTGKSGRWKLWLSLLLVVAAAMAMVAIPVFVIWPFRAQTAAGLEWSYRLRRWSPLATVVATILFLALCVKLWRGARWPGRLVMAALLALVLAITWFAPKNYFEW